MTGKQLKNSILQWAIQGKLVSQDPNDEPASVLLEKIRAEKVQLVKEGKLKKKDLEVKPITDDEIPFEIPKGWEWVRLSKFCTRFSTGPFGTMVHKEDYVDTNGHPLINPTNIKNGRICCDGIKMVSDNKYNELNTYILQTDDIVLARRGDLSKVAVVSKNECGWLAGTGAFFMHFVEVLSLPYFVCLYTSSYCQNYLLNQSVGGTMNNLNQTLLSDFLIPLPPLAEQHRIVAKIEELMPLVEKYGETQEAQEEWKNSLPEKLKKSILQEAIQGKLVPQDPADEPASALLDKIRKEKTKLVKEGKLKKKELEEKPIEENEIPFEIPEGWVWCHLGEIVNMQMGKTPPRGESLYWLNGTDSWVSISDMKDYGHIQSTKEMVSGYAVEHIFKKKSPKGTLLMSFKLTVGRTSILDIPAFHNEAIISIYPYIDTNNSFRNYLFYLLPLLSNLGDSKDAIKGKTLNSTSLNNLLIPLPPLAEQHRIVEKIEELFGVFSA